MNNVNGSEKTRKLVAIGMMIAVTVILGYTPLGIIMIPPISITTLHIPTIISGILLGPVAGLIVGVSMGFVTFLRAMTAASPFDALFINPLVSILPRMFIGLTTYIVYYLLKRFVFKKRSLLYVGICAFVAAIIGTLTNTIGVLGMLYFLYAQEFIQTLGGTLKTVLFGTLTVNITVEMVTAAFITVPIVFALNKTLFKNR